MYHATKNIYFQCKTDKPSKDETKQIYNTFLSICPDRRTRSKPVGSFGISGLTIDCLPTPLITHPTYQDCMPAKVGPSKSCAYEHVVQICQVRLAVIPQDCSNQHEIDQFKQINLSSLGKFNAESCKFLPTDGLVGTIVNCQHHLDGMIDRCVHAHIRICRSRGGLKLTKLNGEFAKINSTRVCEMKRCEMS